MIPHTSLRLTVVVRTPVRFWQPKLNHWNSAALTCILGAVCLAGCAPGAAPAGTANQGTVADVPKVATVKPQRKPLQQKTEQPGQIEAFAVTPIFARTSGYVLQVAVDIGDRVQGPKRDSQGKILAPGQLLAELSAPELDDELAQKQALVGLAEAEVAQAEAAVKVAEAMEVTATANVAEAQAGKERAEATYQRWKSEYQRIRELAANKAVTQKTADEAEQQLHAADATRNEVSAMVLSAQAKHKEAVAGIAKSQADLKTVQARLTAVMADRDRVRTLHGFLQIRAPYTGIISTRNIDTGHLIQSARAPADQPLFVMLQAETVRLFLDVPESDAVLVEPGRAATVTVPALGAQSFIGKVGRTSWGLQTGTRTMKCEIDIPNRDGKLRPGMYAHVELVVAERSNALSIPKSALLQQEGKASCLVVSSEGEVVRKPVTIGLRTATDIEVLTGLNGTEDVISANAAAFREGQKVGRAAK